MEIIEIIKEIKRKNPYPADIFREPTKEQYKMMQKAFKDYGLSPDAFFGSEARRVWNLCCEDMIKFVKDEKSEGATQ